MPDISGIELQSMLIAQGKNLPVIFIAAFPDERIRAQVIKAGAVCILSKPFEGSTLIRCIDNALKTERLKAEPLRSLELRDLVTAEGS
jgi:FixJ family two-component response regulator